MKTALFAPSCRLSESRRLFRLFSANRPKPFSKNEPAHNLYTTPLKVYHKRSQIQIPRPTQKEQPLLGVVSAGVDLLLLLLAG